MTSEGCCGEQYPERRRRKGKMESMEKKVYALVGPTCTYKSSIAIELAKKYPFEIISADSRLIYKGMDIGTSKPTAEERSLAVHHLIDVAEPDFNYSVALYKKEAESKISEVFSKGKIPLFVGGTGLYLNSVLLGLSIPEVKPDFSFRKQLRGFTQEELYENLKNLDPKACEIIHRNDNFRTIRALEVIYKTNKLFSRLRVLQEPPYRIFWLGLKYDDRELHAEKITERTERFCNNDFISEARALLDKYGELELFRSSIGYKEAMDFLKKKSDKRKMIEEIILHTRQLAKRQITWFKANKKINWVVLDRLSYDDSFKRVFNLIEEGSLAKTSMVSIS